MSYIQSFRIPILITSLLLTALLVYTPSYAAVPENASATPLIAAYHGKVVLLDFWASWCTPCRRSFPWMNALQQRLGKDGLVVLAVNVDKERALAEKFLRATPAKFHIEYDPTGDLATLFNVAAMPTSFLIDRQGRIRQQHAGFREGQVKDREQAIMQLLQEPTP